MTLRDGTRVRVGLVVVCNRTTPPRGTWKAHDQRRGVVASINHRDGEIGVSWTLGADDLAKLSADAWFLPTELLPT